MDEGIDERMRLMKKIIYGILVVLPLLAAAFIYPSLPEQIPLHYGVNYQVDRWGSPKEIFVFPLIILIMAAIILFISRILAKREHGEKNQKISLMVGIWMLIFMDLLFAFILYTTSHQVVDLSKVPFEKIVFGGLGLLFIFMGNIMPKIKRNYLFGIRTKWSLYSDLTWKHTHKTGGITSILAGFTLIVISLFAHEEPAIWGAVSIMIIFCLAILLESYLIYKKYKDR